MKLHQIGQNRIDLFVPLIEEASYSWDGERRSGSDVRVPTLCLAELLEENFIKKHGLNGVVWNFYNHPDDPMTLDKNSEANLGTHVPKPRSGDNMAIHNDMINSPTLDPADPVVIYSGFGGAVHESWNLFGDRQCVMIFCRPIHCWSV